MACCFVLLLFLILALPRSAAQDYDAWKQAVELQYGKADALIRYKQVSIDFERKRRSGQPSALLRFSYKIVPTGNLRSLPFTIVLDSHTSVRKIRTEGRRMKPARLDISDYSSQSLQHSDIRVAGFPVEFGKRFRERRVIYTLELDDIRYLAPLYLHDRFAVYETGIRIRVPQWLDLEIAEINMTDSLKFNRTRIVNSKEMMDYTLSAYSFEPGRAQSDQPPPSFIYPHLLFVPRSFETPDRRRQSIFQGLSDLYLWYRNLLEGVENETYMLDRYLTGVVESQEDPLKKMEAVYYWIQENIRYLAYEQGVAGYRPQPAHVVFANRYGDCKGMAYLTRQLLVKAGLDARLAWLGSTYLAYDYTYPTLAVDNHMICAVYHNGDWIFLDPTEPYVRAGSYSENIAGRQVLIEDGENFLLETIPDIGREVNTVELTASLSLADTDEVLAGNMLISCSGTAKQELMQAIYYNNNKSDALRRFLAIDEHQDLEFSRAAWNSWKSRDSAVSLPADMFLRHAAASFGGEIYIDLSSLGILVPPSIDVHRRYDFVPDWNWNISMEYRVVLPEGSRITYLPEPMEMDKGGLRARLEVRPFDDGFYLSYSLEAPPRLVETDSIGDWNAVQASIAEWLRDHVIIEK
jgi:hypothetical protein